MKKVYKKENAITLVALVITIVILLILSGISISALTNTGIFQKSKEAKEKSENAQKQENEILDEYEKEMEQYGDNTLISNFNSGKIKVGDYIKYEPDKITDTDEDYKTLISNFNTYSGCNENTIDTLKQDDINWRVLDVKNGRIRLISDEVTKSILYFRGYNGYNNAVKLLDNTCSILYKNTKWTYEAENIKIEDIIKYMKTKPIENEEEFNKNNVNYPNILLKEKNQNIDGQNELEKNLKTSEQNNFILGNSMTNNAILKYTDFNVTLDKNSFTQNIYYEIFVNKSDSNMNYWISTRFIRVDSLVRFGVKFMKNDSTIASSILCDSAKYEGTNEKQFRPVITLNSGVQLDIQNSGDGSSPEKAYAIK